jgi:hypothetical protein
MNIKNLLTHISIYTVLLCVCMFSGNQATFAQGTEARIIRPVAHAVVNFAELARQEQLIPRSTFVMQAPTPNEGDEENLEEPGIPVPYQPSPFTNQVQVPSPSPVLNYQGAPDEAQGGGTSGSYNIPPDTYGAVGLDKVFVTLNNNYKVLNKTTGAQISLVSMPSFWSSLGVAGSGAFDPRVVYDPFNNRWIHAAVSNAQSVNSKIILAVSRTHDPSGTYDLYAFDPDTTTVNTKWADFPMLGFNKNWVAISINLFNITGSASNGSAILALDYPALRSGTSTGSMFTSNTIGFCVNPCESYSDTVSTLYMPTHVGSGAATYRLNTITGTPAAPVFNIAANLVRTGGGWVQPSGNVAPQQCITAPCPGVLQFMDVGDAFVRSNAVFRNGFIWYSQSVGLPTPTLARVATQWTKISTTGAFVDGGRIDDPTATNANGGRWYTYSSLSVNKNDDVLAGFTKTESDGYAGAAYAMRLGTDAAGTMQDPVVYKDGEDYYDKTSGGRTRWGDYSHVSVDPLDDVSFWTWQEYAKLRAAPSVFSTTAKFGTWVAKVAPLPCLSGVASGNWNTAATWGCGSVPVATSDVNIVSGHNVTLDVNPAARTITVNEGGTLTVNAARTLSCKLIVYGTLNITGGSLTLGSNDVFLARNATLTGATTSSFFITNGTGKVTKMIGGGTSFEFPLSATGTTYNGLLIALNAGDPEEVFSVNVTTGVVPTAGNNNPFFVQRTWNINEMTIGNNNATLTFKWTAADHGGSFVATNPANAFRNNGTNWVFTNAMTTPVLASGVFSANTTGAVSTFSPWAVASQSTFPVKFEYFTGTHQGTSHLLNWKLNCEPTNRSFTVERSADGANFGAIGIVNITNGCLLPFNFTDNAPLTGRNYYRLRVNDNGGRTEYSKIVLLLNQAEGFELTGLYPNPVKSSATLQISAASRSRVDITVTDVTGRLLQQQLSELIAGVNQVDLNFATLSAGTYFIKVVSDKGVEQSLKFVKE